MAPEPVIRSRHNPVYKELRSLLRRDRRHQERAFLVEGPRFIEDAQRFGATPRLLVCTESYGHTIDLQNDQSQSIRILDNELFDTISDTVTSQGLIGVFSFPEITRTDLSVPLVLLADGIQDPGNLGTLIRSAAGAGATQVLALPGTVDPWSPKTVRAAAAAHFVIPVETISFDDLPERLPVGATIIGADAAGTSVFDRIDLTIPLVLVVGSEGNGFSHRTRAIIDQLVSIPLDNGVESLNAAIAGSVLLFEVSRQRRSISDSVKSPVFG